MVAHPIPFVFLVALIKSFTFVPGGGGCSKWEDSGVTVACPVHFTLLFGEILDGHVVWCLIKGICLTKYKPC